MSDIIISILIGHYVHAANRKIANMCL